MLLTALFIRFFLPHEKNNHRAHILNPIFVTLSLLTFLATQFLLPTLPQFTPVVLGYSSDIVPEKIVELTNKERERAGVAQLETDPLLMQAALTKASDMFANNYWAHTAPDGTQPWYFFTTSGYQYRYAGENLARDFSSPQTVVDAWMSSPTHRENLLALRYQDIGVAVVEGELDGIQTTLVVQLFGTKFAASTMPVSVTPVSAREEETEEVATESAVLTTVPAGQGLTELPPPLTSEEAGSSAFSSSAKKIVLSPFSSTKRIALFFLSLFFTILSIDIVIVNRKNISRRASRSFAHLLFFAMIITVLLASQAGIIL